MASRSFFIQYIGDPARQEAVNVAFVVFAVPREGAPEDECQRVSHVNAERMHALGVDPRAAKNLKDHIQKMSEMSLEDLEWHKENSYRGVTQVVHGPTGLPNTTELYELIREILGWEDD